MPSKPETVGHCFSRKYNGMAREIDTSVWIINSLEGQKDLGKEYKAIWDTGATNTVIGKHLADELGLKIVNNVVAYGVDGPYECNCYLVDVALPNKVVIYDVNVLSGDFQGYDVLIGMDIITLGDFALTNLNGKTTCSFRMPSMMEIDFVDKSYFETQ